MEDRLKVVRIVGWMGTVVMAMVAVGGALVGSFGDRLIAMLWGIFLVLLANTLRPDSLDK